MEALYKEIAAVLKEGKPCVALTGAGISAESGIPTFRSKGGLWEKYDPMVYASIEVFRQDPSKYWLIRGEFIRDYDRYQPNAGHYALAVLEEMGALRHLITQNIDGLHRRAGSQNVMPVHGTLETLTCIHCYRQVSAEKYTRSYIEQGIVPRCEVCGDYLKPDVVLFEEQLPAKIWLQARQATDSCDLMLIAGTSLLVSPVAQLPERAWGHGARIIIVNQTPTYMDEHADIVLRGDVAEIIPAIASEVLDD